MICSEFFELFMKDTRVCFHRVCRYSLLGEHVTKHVRLESSIMPFTGSFHLLMCLFIKVTICHVKQLWQQRENGLRNMTFQNGDIRLCVCASVCARFLSFLH